MFNYYSKYASLYAKSPLNRMHFLLLFKQVKLPKFNLLLNLVTTLPMTNQNYFHQVARLLAEATNGLILTLDYK